MIKNNKGFMLIEVIVTTTVIVVAMVALYASFNRLYTNYDARSRYNDIDTILATKFMFQDMIDKQRANYIINEVFYDNVYGYLIKDGTCNSNVFNDSTNDRGVLSHISDCSQLPLFYNVDNMVMVEYDLNSVQKLKDNLDNETFKDYVEYVISYYNITTEEEYQYLLLTEVYDGSDYYYANLRVR